MSEDTKILKKLDSIAKKIDILTKVTAINVQREKFIEGKKQKEQIKALHKAGFSPSLIALILGTTSNTVSVTLSDIRKKKKAKTKKKVVKTNVK